MQLMIKNCPFCGHTCGTGTTMYPTEEETTLAWNTRFEPKTDSITKLQYNKNTLKYVDDEPWHNRIKYTNDKPWKTM